MGRCLDEEIVPLVLVIVPDIGRLKDTCDLLAVGQRLGHELARIDQMSFARARLLHVGQRLIEQRENVLDQLTAQRLLDELIRRSRSSRTK